MVKKTKFIERIPCFLAAGMLFFAACNGMEENLENNQNGEDNGGSDVETPVEPTDSLPSLAAFSVEMEEITAVTAKIKFTVGNKVAASYHVTTEPEGNPAPAVIAKKGTKVSFTDSTYTVSLTDLNAETTYYWYVGWTKPTSLDNLKTLATGTHNGMSLGGQTSKASGEKLLTNSPEIGPMIPPAQYYVVIPSNYNIYDATLQNVPITNTSFSEVTDVTIANHKVYIRYVTEVTVSGLEIY